MSLEVEETVRLTEVASFPPGTFLENLAVRRDGSILVTVPFRRELWCIPPFPAGGARDPVRVATFDLSPMSVVETEPDLFYVATTSIGCGKVHRLDLRSWSVGKSVDARLAVDIADCGWLNGSCLIAPGILLIADSFTSSIWRVDLPDGGDAGNARRWLQHESMAHEPKGPMPDQPGVNGVQFASKSGYLYYTSTAKQLFMRVGVDPRTHDPVGKPEFVTSGMMWDDFCIDEEGGFAYLTTHRQNTVERIWLTSGVNFGKSHCVVGRPFTELLLGPTSAAWGRGPGDYGRVFYVASEGGIKAPMPDGVVRPAKILRIELSPR